MVPDEIPASIQKFIFDHIDSVEQLEVLLWVRGHAENEWDARAISDELRSTPDSVERRLRSLLAHGLLALRDGKYRYSPASEELKRLSDELSNTYRERRITVIQLIFSRPQGALDALRGFANAFKITSRDDHDR